MTQVFRLFAIAVASLSILVHLATFLPFVPVSMTWAWPLHLGAMAAFVPMVLALTKFNKPPNSNALRNPLKWIRESNRSNQQLYNSMLKHVPISVRVLCIVVFIYAAVNFGLFLKDSEGGTPESNAGRYYLSNHGAKIRDLTPQEYRRMQALVVRGFSGHWIVFSLVSAVFYMYISPALTQEQSTRRV
jgi:hypothetical protein